MRIHIGQPLSMDATVSVWHRNVNACMAPEPHQHAVESARLHICQTCPTSRWKLWLSRCRSTDVERTSPAAVADEPSTRHCRRSHESLADQSGCRRQAAMADAWCPWCRRGSGSLFWGQACSRASAQPGSSETSNLGVPAFSGPAFSDPAFSAPPCFCSFW